MAADTDQDFKLLDGVSLPAKRAAYSDRVAWILAILAEFAYTKFDEESEQKIMDLAKELAPLTDQKEITDHLSDLQKLLAGFNPCAGPDFRVEFSLTTLRRLTRFVEFRISGDAQRIDKYNDMSRYRKKLRVRKTAAAITAAQGLQENV